MREVVVAGRQLDAGPTVFTLREVFDELYADAGASFAGQVKLIPAMCWRDMLGTYMSIWTCSRTGSASADAIARFAGPREADGFLRFAAQARRIYDTLNTSFMRSLKPTPLGLSRRIGISHLNDLLNIQPFTTLFKSNSGYFADPRLRQLFARYATYCGSSPYQSPATLMLIAHVEQAGVWYVEGGMHRLAVSLAELAKSLGAEFRYAPRSGASSSAGVAPAGVETPERRPIAVDAVVSNADNNALAAGLFGIDARASVAGTAPKSAFAVGADLESRWRAPKALNSPGHTVFFGSAYASEFEDIFRRRRLPENPTVYVCAQDRYDGTPSMPQAPERLLCLVNAPPSGDTPRIPTCGDRAMRDPDLPATRDLLVSRYHARAGGDAS